MFFTPWPCRRISSPRPSSYPHPVSVGWGHSVETVTHFRCSDDTAVFQAFPLGKLGCSYGLNAQKSSVFHMLCGHSTHARHGHRVFLNVDTHMDVHMSPLWPYFSGLVLRNTFYSDGIYSGSLNFQAWEVVMLESHPDRMPTKWLQRGVRVAGVAKAQLQSGTLATHSREYLSRALKAPLWTHIHGVMHLLPVG